MTVNVFPFVMTMGELDTLAPEGMAVHTTLWGAVVSWSLNVTVEPAATLSVEGWKLSALFAPTPWGITIVYVPPLAAEDVVDGGGVVVVVLVAVVDVVVLVDVVEDEVTADEELVLIVVEDEAAVEELLALEVAVLVAAELVLVTVIVGVPEPFVVHQLVVHVGVAVAVVLLD